MNAQTNERQKVVGFDRTLRAPSRRKLDSGRKSDVTIDNLNL
jgi:hypothetical protein